MPTLRIATFNLENFDDEVGSGPTLDERVVIMRPQLERIRADILCLQEVHSQRDETDARTLSALEELILGTSYANFNLEHTVTVNGELYHERNLVVLTRFPVLGTRIVRDSDMPRPSYQMITADPPDAAPNPVGWERPIFYLRLDLGGGRTLHLANVHMKSKMPVRIPGQTLGKYDWKSASAWAEGSFISVMKRVGQALQVRMLVDEIFDAEGNAALIAVCGDFNSDHDGVPVKAIRGPVEETGNPAHSPRVLVPCEFNIPEASRYSLLHLGKGEMLDHILASRSLVTYFRGAEIHNEVLPDESGAFRGDKEFPESDHAPVVAEFVLP